jgi:hypothetical protein
MTSKSFCSLALLPQAIRPAVISAALIAFLSCLAPRASADAPAWMHAVQNAPLPQHDEKTDAVLLYSENVLSVGANGKIKAVERRAYKILRPSGREHGTIYATYNGETKINSIRGWCIPAQGKDFEVKDKDVVETAVLVANGDLASDFRTKVLHIPAPDPGNIVGYEIEHEDRPYILQDEWGFQETVPVREARYRLELPPGWEYKAVFVNSPEVKASPTGNNQWQWVVSNLEAIRPEDSMPPWRAIAGQMIVSFFPPGGSVNKGFDNWNDMALWEAGLVRGRREPSPEIKQKVVALTQAETSELGKMRALAAFVQSDIRYVAIELGIGGWQPHPAGDIFSHRYGDCKDKATLLSAMLKEIGVDSKYVIVNTRRGAVNPATPAVNWFNHAILAIQVPESLMDGSLVAVYKHNSLGRLLIFDPTDELTPFGYLRGQLQANYGLLVADNGGELIELPRLSGSFNGVRRTAKLTLTPSGGLAGEVTEIRLGDQATYQRELLRSTTSEKDKIKPIESVLAHSLPNYRITKASVTNAQHTSEPFEYRYSIVAENYAKSAGNLLLVRPRVLGNESSDLLETKEPRKFPIEFEGPTLDTNTYEINLPPGYEVDELPPPVDADFGFASYHSKAEAVAGVLRYSRSFELKDVTVPLAKVEDLKKLYRIIASDERNTAVLKPKGQ